MYSSTSALTSKSESEISSLSNKQDEFITITEKIKLKKDQYEVLRIICDTYRSSFSEYIQEALVEAMKFDIEEGNFSDALLEKIGVEDSKKGNSPPSSSHSSLVTGLTNSDLDLLKKMQTQVPSYIRFL
jgi:hypothetical protein